MLLFDAVSLIVVLLIAFSFRLGEFYWPEGEAIGLILIAPVVAIPIFIRMGLYRAIVRYIEFRALWTIVRAVSLYAVIWGAVVYVSGLSGVPRSVILINWVVAILVVGGGRIVARGWLAGATNTRPYGKGLKQNAVIYGAGEDGAQLAQALSRSRELRPIAFIDDSPMLHGHEVNGLKVYPFSGLSRLMEKKRVAEVLLAIPSASRTRRNEIISLLEPYSVQVRTLPSVEDVAYGRVTMDTLREVTIEDLLGRDTVPPHEALLRSNIEDKVVMVTGAGGSIGSELCRQIIRLKPKKLVLFEQSEPALYLIKKELGAASKSDGQLDSISVPVLGSVTDTKRVEQVCRYFNVQTIYHAAAYKHVPLVEMNNTEGVKNNLFGTLYCAQAAIAAEVKDFVLISTDKAVRPTNTMGATKRCAELVLQALAEHQATTKFVMVRFGNVLGSSGSVVPLFRQQIKQGGPLTVTDPKIIRYFMTIPEAAQLVIQAGALGDNGNVLVLDMGEPIRIVDLAKKMVHLSGLEVKDEDRPDGDIEIEFTGLRPGEKLYEELLIGENALPTNHPMISRAEEERLSWNDLEALLTGLKQATEQYNHEQVRELLRQAVSGFNPQCEICDLTYDNEVAD